MQVDKNTLSKRLEYAQKDYDDLSGRYNEKVIVLEAANNEIDRLTQQLVQQKESVEQKAFDTLFGQVNQRMATSYRIGFYDAKQTDRSFRFFKNPQAYDAQLGVTSILPEGEEVCTLQG